MGSNQRTKKGYRIAIIPGDGVGPEVSQEAVKVVKEAVKGSDISFDLEWFDWGCDFCCVLETTSSGRGFFTFP